MVLGLVIGAAVAALFMVALRKGRRHRRGRCRRGLFRNRRLYRVFEQLDTTPGQEKAIRTAWLSFAEDARSARDELGASLHALAEAVRGGEIDDGSLDAIFAKHDELIARLRRSAKDGLREVHGALDDRQRRRLAEMLESRLQRRGRRGPYRDRAG